MKTKTVILGGIVVLAIPTVWFYLNSRFHTATTPYTVVWGEGEFEMRDYPARIVASTAAGDGENPGFMRLYQFITGGNAKAEKIPMTTPVLVEPSGGAPEMSFILPEELTNRAVPEPKGEAVRLNRIEPGRYAVLRFEGGTDAASRNAAIAKLQAWLKERQIEAVGDPVAAYYDPPWTPHFLRRNEVMVRVGK